MIGLMKPVSAGAPITLSASPTTVTVTAGGSASTTITFHIPFPPISNPMIDCIGLPAGASCSTTPNPLSGLFDDLSQFTLTVSALYSTAPGTYSVTVQLTSYSTPGMIQPGFLAISPASSGGIGPSSISIQQAVASVTITVVVNPAHPIAVGGEMIPINQAQVLLPWLALIAVLTILFVETLIRRRRTTG